MLPLPLPLEAVTGLYVLTIGTGYVCLLMGGLGMSRLWKHNLMEDVFNNENESFMQETRLIESEYSVNLPTRCLLYTSAPHRAVRISFQAHE